MITEDQLEQQCLGWFREGGWETVFGPDIAHDGAAPERANYREVVLVGRLTRSLARLNPGVPAAVLDEAVQRLLKLDHPVPEQRNRDFHRLLLAGIKVSWREGDGVKPEDLRLVDFANPDANEFLVVNQFAIRGPNKTRRPDLVIFINGLPLAIIELKNPADEQADIWKAWQQLQTYKEEIPDIFNYNEALIVSDGFTARVGSLTADPERFMPWRTLKNEDDKPVVEFEIEKIVRGFFDRELFLDYLKHFILFESHGDRLEKKIAGYHQFHAVREAVRVTIIASALPKRGRGEESRAAYGKEVVPGSRKAGVVWHTQGSGKSISMVCYAGKLIQQPEMRNPTLVVVTDRNDLDGQLYETFCGAQELLRQKPEQAENREELREKLMSRQAGGIIFTTVQKFSLADGEKGHPQLCDRSNVVVISDEAHRSQYGLKAVLKKKTGRYVYGFAKHMRDALPFASFIGFTGTPISREDRDTTAVFGDYVSVYDIQDAVDDGATVEIFYESRLAKLDVYSAEIEKLSAQAEEIVEEEEDLAKREQTKGVWTALEKLVGAKERIDEVAADLVAHFEARTAVIEGKAMIVGMSREVCAKLYAAIRKLRPEWHDDDIEKGAIKVVMTGSASDEPLLRPHVTTKRQKKRLEKRFKNPADPLRLVIVRDMWLTGFDAPCCHTMYVDKPMKGHNLMQAIARVNRVFKDKPGGLVVDYIGIANDLKAALKIYVDSKGRGQPSRRAEEYLDVLREKLDACRGLFHGFDYSAYEKNPTALLVPAANWILDAKRLPDGKKRFLDLVSAITRAFALCGTLDEAAELRTEIAFFSAVKAAIVKYTTVDRKLTDAEKHSALRRILDNAIKSEGVSDIFALAGINKPNIGLLSPEFLEDVRNMPQKNLAVELLEKLLRDEIKAHTRTNVVLQKKFGDRLLESIRRYHNRAVETAQVIEELLRMAEDFKQAISRNEELGLTSDEVAFYDALAERPEVLREMGDVTLKRLAQELTQQLRSSTTVDWQVRDSVRAKMRILIKRLLKKYKYPPEGQEEAVALVLKQAETLADEWSESETISVRGNAYILSDSPALSLPPGARVSMREPLPPGDQPPLEFHLDPALGARATHPLPEHLLEDPKSVPVWYGTNRKPNDITDERQGYSGDPDTVTHHGYCMVNVPRGYVRGGPGHGWLRRLLAGEKTKLDLGNINPLGAEEFWGRLEATLAKELDSDSMLLFIHGYRSTFEDAARRAGQLSYELDLPAAFFSWPSRGNLLGYWADEDQVTAAVPTITDFIAQMLVVARRAGKRLHVVAHSMGNRALLRALNTIASKGDAALGQIIYAAPDVHRVEFLQLIGQVTKLGKRSTLYASKADLPVRLSKKLHQNPRAGFIPPVTIAPNLDTIDATKYDLSLLGHGSCLDLGPVMSDLFSVIHDEARPAQKRHGMTKGPASNHWVLG